MKTGKTSLSNGDSKGDHKLKKSITKASWDATLDTGMCDRYNNAELTITLRLAFKQVNPAGGASSGTYHDYGDSRAPSRKVVKWSASDWTSWKQTFIQSAERFWKDKFWLINNFPELEFTDKSIKYIPNIWCRFKLSGSDASPSFKHHHMIEVVKLHPSETWFGSHSKLYDSLDSKSVQKGTDSKGNAIMQRAHVHEIGHLLGLGHVDEGKTHCPSSNTNASGCYGVTDSDKNSVMGQGMQLRREHAVPWRKAMVAILAKGNSQISTDWEAVTRRHYPRTQAEVANKAKITTKPNRN